VRSRTFLFAGSYSDPTFPPGSTGRGITLLALDPATGTLEALESFSGPHNPSYLAVSPDGRSLFAVHETEVTADQPEGLVSSWALEGLPPRPVWRNTVASKGSWPCHLALAPDGRAVVVANYGTGTVASLPLGADGRLGPASAVDQHLGQGPTDRQRGPHGHQVVFGPGGRTLYAVDLGTDRVHTCAWDGPGARLGAVGPAWAVTPGSGPRHLVFSASGRQFFVVNELEATVEVFADPEGREVWERVQVVSTLGPGVQAFAGAAALRLSADGRFLYVSLRAEVNTVVWFAVGPEGRLERRGEVPSGGRGPRDFVLNPTGRWLLVAHQETGRVTVFAVDPSTGALTATDGGTEVPSAVSLVLVPTLA